MKSVSKSVLIWYSPQEMFNLVADVASYPQFLPWCNDAQVLHTHADGVTARIGLRFGGVSQQFSTRNVHSQTEQEHSIALSLVDGPFSKLDGLWRFVPIGGAGARACRVELQLGYAFSSRALAALVGPVFDKVAASLVDAFVERAQAVYGAVP
jgi:ribosome-associated toxin RatA of RatAB toxin-antitoxin module